MPRRRMFENTASVWRWPASTGPATSRVVTAGTGRTRSGRLAQPLKYPLHVQPFWYQTPLAWVAGSVLLLFVAGLTQLIVRIRYRQFVATRKRLERKISERTAELETANRKLAELATEAKSGNAERFTAAPMKAPRRRLDETRAARQPILKWERPADLPKAAE